MIESDDISVKSEKKISKFLHIIHSDELIVSCFGHHRIGNSELMRSKIITRYILCFNIVHDIRLAVNGSPLVVGKFALEDILDTKVILDVFIERFFSFQKIMQLINLICSCM